jgi:hypothetical protein
MPSLQDLPNEIMDMLELDVPDLLSLVLVNSRFYQTFIGYIYSGFHHYEYSRGWIEQNDVRGAERLRQFFTTIISSPALANHVKSLSLTGDWREELSVFGWIEERIAPLTREWFLAAANANVLPIQATYDDLFKGLVIALFPEVEQLRIELFWKDTFAHAMRCHKLKTIEVENSSGVSLRNIAGLLQLPHLEVLSFTYEFRMDNSGSLNSVLARSSPVQDLRIYHCKKPRTMGHVNREADIMAQLLSKFKNLKSLYLSKEVHDGRTGERLESSLSLVKESLEYLFYGVYRVKYRQLSNKAVLSALREYPKLKTLDISPLFLLPMDRTQQSHLSSSLPTTLKQLGLHAGSSHPEFAPERWLAITRNITGDKPRLSALARIIIHVPEYDHYDCKATREPCLWCIKNETLDAMKRLCKDANVELKVICDSFPEEEEIECIEP